MKRTWTPDEIETVRLNYADWPTYVIAHLVDRPEAAVYRLAYKLGLRKSDVFLASEKSGRVMRGMQDPQMRATQFKPGQVPANKGLRRPGWAPGRMADTQFRKGERRGVAVKLYQPIGTLRVTKDGTLQQKVNDELPLQRRWKAFHAVVWEAANGPIPPGHIVVFRNRQKTSVEAEITLDRLELISRAENCRRNTIHRYPPELRDVMKLTGRLKRKIRDRSQDNAERRA